MRVISFTRNQNRPPNSNKNAIETKIGDIITGRNDKNRKYLSVQKVAFFQ